jgi:hypothetical protein
MRQLLAEIELDCGQKKLATTEKGVVFLEKSLELQKLAGIKSRWGFGMPNSALQTVCGLPHIKVPTGFCPSKTDTTRSGKKPLIT